jgi:hypothetical protein
MQLGKRKLMVGTALTPLVTVKLIGFEVPLLGAGLVTVTSDTPVEAMLEAGMAAVTSVELTNVAAGAEPLKLTVDDATKFVPLILRVKAAPPATAVFGEMEVIVGAGGGGLPPDRLDPLPHALRIHRPKIVAASNAEPFIFTPLSASLGSRNATADRVATFS